MLKNIHLWLGGGMFITNWLIPAATNKCQICLLDSLEAKQTKKVYQNQHWTQEKTQDKIKPKDYFHLHVPHKLSKSDSIVFLAVSLKPQSSKTDSNCTVMADEVIYCDVTQTETGNKKLC